jgi:hypothetical protein
MRKFLLLFALLTIAVTTKAQELNASVTVDASQTAVQDLQVFRTLQRQLTEFISTTRWTNKEYKNQERIDCNFTIIVSEYSSDLFSATLQIQASRPVYKSTYDTPIYNYNDKQFSFDYVEFQPLNFNLNTFDSNLMSVIAFHVYTIIGLDASTFEPNGGDPYYETAKQIVNTAASSNFLGWKANDSKPSRYSFNDDLISSVYKQFHDVMYNYHRLGLDLMSIDTKIAKNGIKKSLSDLKRINDRRPNSFLLRTFFDAKAEEIQSIYSGGPSVEIATLVENLNRMAPTKRDNWREIKF